jgi:hypothetical protein
MSPHKTTDRRALKTLRRGLCQTVGDTPPQRGAHSDELLDANSDGLGAVGAGAAAAAVCAGSVTVSVSEKVTIVQRFGRI